MHIARRTNQELVGVCMLLLFALVSWRREVVTFDAGRQEARWHRRRAFKTAEGTVPFAEIKGISIDSQSSGSRGNLTYRLTILTTGSPVPMSDVYGGNRSRYDRLRSQILEFLQIEGNEESSPGLADEAAIRSLLMRGRKVEAIQRLRSCERIGLAEATDRVNAIGEKMKTTQ